MTMQRPASRARGMEVAVSAARWVVGKALAPVADGVLEAWAASAGLGPNVDALKMELLYAQGMLDNVQGREVRSPALKQLLDKLRQLAYSADDVLDELEYFRIQDELDGTYHAAGEHDGGCLRDHALNARHTAKAIGKMLGLSSCSCRCSACRGDHGEPSEGKRGASCGGWPCGGSSRTLDDEQEEADASRGALCGAAWPCPRRRQPSPLANDSSSATVQVDTEAGRGCMRKLASGARHTIDTIGKHLPCYSISPVENDANSSIASTGWRFLCCACPKKAPQRERLVDEVPKLKFDRVDMSIRMKEIVEQLKPVCAKVSTILNLELLDSNRSISQCIAMSLDLVLSKKEGSAPLIMDTVAMNRPKTTPVLIEPKLYGREQEKNELISNITEGKYSNNDLTVLPIVGPGGIGKTTLAQYIYKELQEYFEVTIWVCVSVNFNVHRLIQEIADNITDDRKKSPDKLIEERLQSKKFLLVLDDIWSCSNEDDWKRFLALFAKVKSKGNMILVTTRFPALANMVKRGHDLIDLKGLDPQDFKDFFYACIFGDKKARIDHNWLLDTRDRIADKLKGSPLAAKTVGRLLRNHLDMDHWTRVLESREWESQSGDHDIMPALKLSYDYLPFHLKQCFTYSALFPEDYKFEMEELIHLWIGLDVLHSRGENKRIEDIGQNYLEELVNHGFFKKEEQKNRPTCYIIHDLLHELALKVSSHECVSIYSTSLRTIQIPPSIRHLSINIDDMSVKDRMTFDTCKKDLGAIQKRIKAENLQSLMFFGKYYDSFGKIFDDLFKKAKALRIIFLSDASYNVEDLLSQTFIHLRYLRIQNGFAVRLPNNVSRFYHLKVLDIQGCYDCNVLVRDMVNLIKLRHFLVESNEVHSGIFEVGKLKSLQELRKFLVKKETQGFELKQIGQLAELHGSLCIGNLEKVEVKEEAIEAELMQKNHLHELILEWDITRSNMDHIREEQVLESLKPSSNLLKLCIRGHGGRSCPSWLGVNLVVKSLESLHLDAIAWKTFPPIEELWLINEHGKEVTSKISNKKFDRLRRLELANLQGLKKWGGDAPCQLFPLLEVLIIQDCSELVELSFSHTTCCQQEKDGSISWFPKLQELNIKNCPNLLSFPSIPWTKAPCSVDIWRVGSAYERLLCCNDYESKYSLEIHANDDSDSMFWDVLSFYNLIELKVFIMKKCPPLRLDHFQVLSSLKSLKVHYSSSAFLLVEDGGQVKYQFPVEHMEIWECGVNGNELTQILTHFPKLLTLDLQFCGKITGLAVSQQQDTTPPAPASSTLANSIWEVAQIKPHQLQDSIGGEEIAVSTADGLLLLPPQLYRLIIFDCRELILSRNPRDHKNEVGPTGGGGLQGLHSLRSLEILECPKFLSSHSPSSFSSFPFPNSLEYLYLPDVKGMETLMPLSNLSSLTNLTISSGGEDLRGEGLWPLLAQGHLTGLSVFRTPKFFVGSEPSRLQEQETPSRSFKLQELRTDDIGGVLVSPICSLLGFSLTILEFWFDEVERFTKEQDEALQLLSSLQELEFWQCNKLQCLPAGLRRLPNLKRLKVRGCVAIRSLPKDGLPSSLQELEINYCPAIRSLPKECLPSSLQKLRIWDCPSIRSLPKVDDLPSSLQELDVCLRNSKELTRQCRKLTGTIPIVRAD
ncbi:hypothetical protein ACP4OV_025653 [Aristida adscensionis]